MKIVVATVQVPFVRGGAEVLAEDLIGALTGAGHEVDTIAIPFKWYPAERLMDGMLACRLLDLTESHGQRIDLVIGLKFPAYLLPHPNKVLWLLHQHRQAYDQWESAHNDLIQSPSGARMRTVIHQADRHFIPQAKKVFTIAGNVTNRLKRFCGIDSSVLYPPPRNAGEFYCADAEDFLFFPSRLNASKRQALVVEALAHTRQPVCVRFAGSADDPAYEAGLKVLAGKLKVQNRIAWLGQVTEEEKRSLYARATAIVYPPEDEDYGYVTLEAMLASKPVVTCRDAGGPLEFVQDGQTGLVVEPTPQALAAALDEVWKDRGQARQWGHAGRGFYESLDIRWPKVVERLLACA